MITAMKRELILSNEYVEFERKQNKRTREKLLYVIRILESEQLLSTKFVKKLVNTDFYELRISVENEVRVILFAVDNDNVNLATRIILLNGFVKKSTKDYDKELEKAINILNDLL
jgi:phage-related protein